LAVSVPVVLAARPPLPATSLPQAPAPPHAGAFTRRVLLLFVVGVIRGREERHVVETDASWRIPKAAGGAVDIKGNVRLGGTQGWRKEWT